MGVLHNSDLDFDNASRVVNLPDPTLSQHAATKAYVDSAIEGVNWKDSVRVASTANINLSSPGATIDGVTMATNDRFLAKDQSTASQNGIYIFNGASTAATRSPDMNVAVEVEQATTTVEEGTAAGVTYRQTAINVTLGSTSIAWTTFGTAAPSASESTSGVAEIADQTETDAGIADDKIVTPLKLATYSGRAKRYSTDFGDGSATSYVITHSLGTLDVMVYIRETGGSKRMVIAEVQHTSTNTITILTETAPASGAYRVTVVA